MNKKIKSIISTWLLILFWYIWVTADYSWLVKNTGDTLTATNWNQLVDNVKWIQTGSNWFVWIGTTSPERELHISWVNPAIIINDEWTSDPVLFFRDAWVQTGWIRVDESDGNKLKIETTNSNPAITITPSNDIWIWTTNPWKRLTVNWESEFQWYRTILNNENAQIRLWNQHANGSWGIWISWDASHDFFITNHMTWNHVFWIDDSNDNISMVAQTSWNVWIGTFAPTDKLLVVWDITAKGSNTTDDYFGKFKIQRSDNSLSHFELRMFDEAIENTPIEFASTNGNDMIFTWNWTELMKVRLWWNVWIGTNWDYAKLDVGWNIKIAESSTTCNGSYAWAIKFSGWQFQGCTGTTWVNLH